MSADKTTRPDSTAQTYQVVPGPEMGLVSPATLATIAKVAQKFNIPQLKITAAQRLAFVGHKPDDLQAIWQELGHSDGPVKAAGIHYVQACPGVNHCRYGHQDSLSLGQRLEGELIAMALPAKTKIGISGCAMNCCECFVRDLGIFGKKQGWTLVFGGNGGGRPRIGDIIAENLSDRQVIDLAHRCLQLYRELARPRERTARLMERITVAGFKAALND